MHGWDVAEIYTYGQKSSKLLTSSNSKKVATNRVSNDVATIKHLLTIGEMVEAASELAVDSGHRFGF